MAHNIARDNKGNPYGTFTTLAEAEEMVGRLTDNGGTRDEYKADACGSLFVVRCYDEEGFYLGVV